MTIFLKQCLAAIFFIALSYTISAQNITTEGADFWLGFMENHETSQIDLEIYISATDTTACIIEMPHYSLVTNITAYPDSTVRVVVPTNYAMNKSSGVLADRGVHIQAEKNITVFALNKRQYSSDATAVLPTISLGKDYLVMAHLTPYEPGPSLYSECLVVGVEDNTEIEITPSVNTRDGKQAGQPFTIMLQQGSTYQLQSASDLTGTRIVALNTSAGDCKNFAVFGGNEWTRIGGCGSAQDHLYEQMFPVNTWGRAFISVPFKSRSGGDILKIMAGFDSTTVQISGGQSIRLNKGQYTQVLRSGPQYITANNPISVAQFSRSQSCDNVQADPFMIMLSPVEQTLKQITFNAFEIHVVERYYLNVITPTDAADLLTLDGKKIDSLFSTVPSNPDFSYAQVDISDGNHTIRSDSGFAAYVYGYGNIESFGYATGVSLKNLNVNIISAVPGTDYTVPRDSACIRDDFAFRVQADSSFIFFHWDFGDGILGDGKEVIHSYAKEGVYPVKVTASTAQGSCLTEETSIRYVYIMKPKVRILGPRSVCPTTDSISYSLQLLKGDSRTTFEWFAEGGIIVGDNTMDRVLVNWAGTNNNAKIKVLAQNSLGCFGDTTIFPVKINIQLDPSAPFGDERLCSDLADTIPYETFYSNHSHYEWFTYFGKINEGQGGNEINMTWDGPGYGQLWYTESSMLDSVCAGVSDTLTVFIERAPDEQITISVQDQVHYNMDSVLIRITADPAFNYYSWDMGDGHTEDSIVRDDFKTHVYSCEGTYALQISAYTGTVCQNLGAGTYNLTIHPPELELINVSVDTLDDSGIDIRWIFTGSSNYNQDIRLYREAIYPISGKRSYLKAFSWDQETFQDSFNEQVSNVYQYSLATNHSCGIVETPPQNNLLLLATKNDMDTTTTVSWNQYLNWMQGIDHYEIWRKTDHQAYDIIETAVIEEAVFAYEQDGFDFCYRIRALESSGNHSDSWSNQSCVEFVPEIKPYNLFTPNGDEFNPYLVFNQIELYPNSVLEIYNRYGKKIRTFNGYKNNWDGKINGRPVTSGVYYYYLHLHEPRATEQEIKGFFSILY